MYIAVNPNPLNNNTGDCVIRAISIAEGKEWDDVYLDLMVEGFFSKLMIEDNRLWTKYLHGLGYRRYNIPDTCPDCYLIKDFVRDNPQGVFILGTGTHTVTCIDGRLFDTWDSSECVPLFYFKKEG